MSNIARLALTAASLGVVFTLASCTGGGSDSSKSTIKLALPDFKAQSSKVSSKSVQAAGGGGSGVQRIVINVTAPDLSAPIVWIWQGKSDSDVAPTEATLEVPKGAGRMVQILAVSSEDKSVFSSPYLCTSGDGGDSKISFYYGDATTSVSGKTQDVAIEVANLGGSVGSEGKVAGRFLPNANVNRGPSGKMTTKLVLPGKPAMVVEEREVFDGWFTAFALEGVSFRYDINGQNILPGDFNLADAESFLRKTAASASSAMLIQTASGWQQKFGNGSVCGAVQRSPKKFVIGAFGPGASAMNLCVPVATQLTLFNSVNYVAPNFIFGGPTSWSAASTNSTDAHVIYPSVGIGTTGAGTCAAGTDQVDRLTFLAATVGGDSGGDNLLGVAGPFLTATGSLTSAASAGGLSINWNYLSNMDSVLSSADVFVRTGLYANGTATSNNGDADFRDKDDGYKCSSLSTMGFSLAGNAGKDASGHLQTSFNIPGVTATQISSRQVQVVVCPKIDARYLASGLACGDRDACGGSTPMVPTASSATSTLALGFSTQMAGVAGTVTLTVRDTNGAPMLSSGAAVVFSTTGVGTGTFTGQQANADGTVTVSFVGMQAGLINFSATINGNALTSASPSATILPAGPSAATSTLTFASASLLPSATTTAVAVVRDQYNNVVTATATLGLSVLSGCSSGIGVGSFSPNGVPGTYAALMTGTFAGSPCNFQLVVNGVPSSTALLAVESPTGQFAFAANEQTNKIYTMGVSSETGALSRISDLTVPSTMIKEVVPHRSGRFVYVLSRGANKIYQYAVNASNGMLTSVSDFNLLTIPHTLMLDPTGRFAYVSNGTNLIYGFSIDPNTGSLTSFGSTNTGIAPSAMTTDASGRMLYVVSVTDAKISSYSISSTGSLSLVGVPIATGSTPTAVKVDRSGQWVLVTNSGGTTVFVYPINPSTGALGAPMSTITGLGPFAAQFDVTGKFVYIANATAGTVDAFQFNSFTGMLTPNGTYPSGAGLLAGLTIGKKSLTLDPSRRYLYVSNYVSNTVTRFAINPTNGTLGVGIETSLDATPGLIALSTTGGPTKFAYATALTGTVDSYAVNPLNGIWTSTGMSQPSPSGARSIVFDPARKFLYLAGESGSLGIFAISRSTGNLTSVGGGAISATARGAAIDPYGRFLYTVHDPAGVAAFALNPSTGAATFVASPVSAGSQPYAIAVHPSGRFVYVGNYEGTVSQFSVDPMSGMLTNFGVPLSVGSGLGTGIQSLKVSEDGRTVYVTSRDQARVYMFRVALDTGSLTANGYTPLTPGNDTQSIALDPTGRFGYTVGTGGLITQGDLLAVAGGFSLGGGTYSSSGTSTPQISVDDTGRWAYVTDYNNNKVSLFSIDIMGGFLNAFTPPTIGTSPSYTTSAAAIR